MARNHRARQTGCRVFLSYGRRDAAFASRLARDLERHGHRLWLDRRRIVGGAVWESEIAAGLDWATAAGKDGRLLLLATPQSIRPGGYCLNELGRALQRRLTVVPVMLESVELPLSIQGIQYVDLRGCLPISRNTSRYHARLKEVLRALEPAALNEDGLQAYLHTLLKPLCAQADLASHIPHFVGRAWFWQQFDEWLRHPDRPLLWICGVPGSGKSAIAAQLCKRTSVAALHVCQYDDVDKASAAKAIRSLASQLLAHSPQYFEQLKWRVADLKELCERSPCDGDASTLFDRLIVQPLRAISRPERKIIILIDALDEATRNKRNELAEVLATHGHNLPSWAKLVITSSAEMEIGVPLQSLSAIDLLPRAPENTADVLAFIDRQLRTFPDVPRRELPSIKKSILAKSEGNWLYLEWLRRNIASGKIVSDSLTDLPSGIGGVLHRMFRQKFPDITAYEERYRPLASLLVALREPMSIDEVARVLEWSPEAKIDVPRAFGALLDCSGGRLRFYHHSLVAWLSAPEHSGQYLAPPECGHRRLASRAWQELSRGHDAMSGYSKRHIAAHLAGCGDEERLRQCVVDPRLIAFASASGELCAFTESWRGAGVSQMRDALRRNFEQLIGHVHAAELYEAACACIELLRQVANYSDAMWFCDRLGALSSLLDPVMEGHIHFEAGWCLRHMERFREAVARLDLASQCYEQAEQPSAAARALSAKSMCLWHLLEDAQGLECCEQALASYEAAGHQRGIAEAHNHMGIILRSLGRCDEALWHLTIAKDGFEALEDQQGLGKCLNSMGTAHWWRGDRREARRHYTLADQINSRINQPYVQGLTANNMGYLELEDGAVEAARIAFARAREFRRAMRTPAYEMLDLSGMAICEFKSGNVDRARKWSRQAMEGLKGVECIEDMHRAYFNHWLICKGGDSDERESAAAALDRARQLLRRRFDAIGTHSSRGSFLRNVPHAHELLRRTSSSRPGIGPRRARYARSAEGPVPRASRPRHQRTAVSPVSTPRNRTRPA